MLNHEEFVKKFCNKCYAQGMCQPHICEDLMCAGDTEPNKNLKQGNNFITKEELLRDVPEKYKKLCVGTEEKGCEICEFKGECPVFIMAGHKQVEKEITQIKKSLKEMCEALGGKFKDPLDPPELFVL